MPVRDDKTSEPFSTSCPALSPRCRHDPQLAISPRDPDFKQTSPCTLRAVLSKKQTQTLIARFGNFCWYFLSIERKQTQRNDALWLADILVTNSDIGWYSCGWLISEKSNNIFVSILPNLFDARAGFDQTHFFIPNSSTNEKPAMCLALLLIAVCFLDGTGFTVIYSW